MSTRSADGPPSARPEGRRAPVPAALCLLLVALCIVGSVAPVPVLAAEPDQTITIGESNTTAQREELLAYFQAGDDDRVLDVTVAETQRAMEGLFDVSDITSAHSSTALTCRAAGTGLEVETHNIDVVPPALYAMALATAGIDDATLVVAAPDDAPAEGMTALTGVFRTWDLAPCGGASLDEGRQRLALEELALAVRIGQGLSDEDGVSAATDLLFAVQQAVIVGRPGDRAAVEGIVATQERATGVDLSAGQRDDLVDLMTRLAREAIEWGSLSRGWTLGRDEASSRVTLVALAVGGPTGGVGAEPTATATAVPTATPPTAANAVDAAPASTGTVNASGTRWPLRFAGALGSLALLALLVGGLLMVLRRRRQRPAAITFTPKSRSALASAVRLRVVGPATRLPSKSWYRARHRPGHPDSTVV